MLIYTLECSINIVCHFATHPVCLKCKMGSVRKARPLTNPLTKAQTKP